MKTRLLTLTAVLALAACSEPEFPTEQQYGTSPQLPAPQQYLIPPLAISEPIGFAEGETPVAPEGFTVTRFAGDLKVPRNVLALPNGDVLVAEGGAPKGKPVLRPKDVIVNIVKGKAGTKVKPGMAVVLLRDSDGDGVAEQRTTLVEKLDSPFGLAQVGDRLYVAEAGAIREYAFAPGQASIAGPGRELTKLPGSPTNHHWTKSLTASPDGQRLYVGVGSNSNIVERGEDAEGSRALIYEVLLPSGAMRIYATGLRNPNGLTFHPDTGELWAAVNERDELGENLVPDYITSVRDGGFYGWPWSYFGQNVDPRVMPRRPDKVRTAIVPDYSLGSHVAPLGMAFVPAGWPAAWSGGVMVGEHGSWNRSEFSGYRVRFVPLVGGKAQGEARDFLTGFITDDGKTRGRPVGIAYGPDGALYVADDVANAVWRIAPSGTAPALPRSAAASPNARGAGPS